MKYQGQILDGQMHGDGKLTYDNGEYYDGEWVKGRLVLDTINFVTVLHSTCNIICCRQTTWPWRILVYR